ncbi:Hypothetical predicted protein [Mytilus galloprovincialis]|uniref:Uncharacterized protein n=2 Tax=Mytilus galloprovincialis TaxID=29158 RepID=A0A8B6BFA9_MYTGA|nr:Hypothetical predicted protein [Mytilus galloprovincialis]
MMKTSIMIIFICIYCSAFFTIAELKKKESKHRLTKRGAFSLPSMVNVLITSSFRMRTDFANNELQSAGEVALLVVGSIPVIGDIIRLFTDRPNQRYDIERGLREINGNLKVLNNNIKKIGIKVEELSKKIDLSVLKNQVATDKREISNCYEDFLLFLPNPLSRAEQDRLKNCYSKFSYIRQIGSILKNDKLTFMQKPIFDQIIEVTGYCDGERIKDVFGFLLGIYIEGCIALITSEVLEYGEESTTFKDECVTTLRVSTNVLKDIFFSCKKVPCNKYIQVMTDILKANQTSVIELQLQAVFPWFKFVIVSLRRGKSSGIALYNLHVFNYIALSSSGYVYRVIIWSTYYFFIYNFGDTYGVGYKENEVEYMYNGQYLIETTTNGLTMLQGFFANIHMIPPICNHDVNHDIDSNIKDLQSQNNKSIPGWSIALIVISAVIALIIAFCIYQCCRN